MRAVSLFLLSLLVVVRSQSATTKTVIEDMQGDPIQSFVFGRRHIIAKSDHHDELYKVLVIPPRRRRLHRQAEARRMMGDKDRYPEDYYVPNYEKEVVLSLKPSSSSPSIFTSPANSSTAMTANTLFTKCHHGKRSHRPMKHKSSEKEETNIDKKTHKSKSIKKDDHVLLSDDESKEDNDDDDDDAEPCGEGDREEGEEAHHPPRNEGKKYLGGSHNQHIHVANDLSPTPSRIVQVGAGFRDEEATTNTTTAKTTPTPKVSKGSKVDKSHYRNDEDHHHEGKEDDQDDLETINDSARNVQQQEQHEKYEFVQRHDSATQRLPNLAAVVMVVLFNACYCY